MPSHILVNGLGLTYKGTIGFSTATIPDVCKTPSPAGPVPIPYPNFAQQSSLTDGTTTVFAKGEMIAVKGSHYSSSNGDEAGTLGGVKSNVNMKATDWITYSFDVKMDGKNACRHTDKKFHNNQNTIDLQGNTDPVVALSLDQTLGLLCQIFCECKAEAQAGKFETLVDPSAFDLPDFGLDSDEQPGRAMYQKCVERKFKKDYENTNVIPEQSYDMNTNPPSPVSDRPAGSRRPDFVRLIGSGPACAPNIDVIEMKFPGDSYRPGQEEDYMRIGGDKAVTTLDTDSCEC